jgi:hypothetical protein
MDEPAPESRIPTRPISSTVLVAIAVALVLSGLGAWILRSRSGSEICAATTCTYLDGEHGWALDFSRGWRLQPYDGTTCERFDPPDGSPFFGVVVSNLTRDLDRPPEASGCGHVWDYRSVPADMVVVDIHGGPSTLNDVVEQALGFNVDMGHLPLTVGDATTITSVSPDYGAPLPYRTWGFEIGRDVYEVALLQGPNARPEDVARAERVVASITLAAEALHGS